MRVLIIGAGNVGNAFVAALSQRHEVWLWADPEHPGSIAKIRENGHLDAIDAFEGRYHPKVVKDLHQAVQETAAILVTIPASGTAREDLMEKFRTCDLKKHLLIWVPGNMSSLLVQNGELKLRTRCTFETATSPFGCRMNGDIVFVKSMKRVIEIASYDPSQDHSLREEVASLFPQRLKWLRNTLEIGLTNISAVIHPAAVLMNAGRIENTGGDFRFYGEGMTRSITTVMTAVDAVRLAILKQFRFNQLSYVDLSNRWYGTHEPDFETFAQTSLPHNLTKGSPTDMNHRYLTEDCRMLAFLSELGNLFRIDTKPIDSVLWLASAVTGLEFKESGITLRKVGMDAMSAEEVVKRWGGTQ